MLAQLRIFLGILSLLLVVSTIGKAQYVDISINPLSALTGTGVLMVEVPVNQTMSVELQSSYFFKAQRFWKPNYFTKGYRIGALGHLYMNEDLEHTEWSIFAYGRYLDVRYESISEAATFFDRDSYHLTKMAIGFGASFKRQFGEYIFLSVGGGIGRNFARHLTRDEGNTGDFMSLGYQENSDIDVYGRVTVGCRLRYPNSGS